VTSSADEVRQIPVDEQLQDIVELVATGPVDLGAYTQAEMAVVLGDVPVLVGSTDDVLAEAVRSLAARGLLYRTQRDEINVVGDLGLLVALIPSTRGTLEIRRGHPGPSQEPWRWLVSVLPRGVVAVDRIDALGLHRLALLSVRGVADTIVERLLDGPARIPRDDPGPVPVTAGELRRVAAQASSRWQLVHRRPVSGTSVLALEAQVMRTGETRVDLLTRDPDSEGFTRIAVDAESLRRFLVELAELE